MPQIRGIMPLLRKPTGEGERVASEISQPFLQGLRGLAEQRMQDMQSRAARQRTETGLMEAIPGLTQEKAKALSGLSEKQLSEYIKSQGEQARAEAFERALERSGITPPGQTPFTEETPGTEPAGTTPEDLSGEARPVRRSLGEDGRAKTEAPPRLSAEDQRRLAEMRQKQSQFGEKQKLEKQKLFQSREDEAYQKEINAQRTLHDIKNMLELEQRGQLNDPKYLQFLEVMGADYDQLKNPETSIYEKLNSRFIMSIKDAFKGKISDNQMAAFLKQFPKLTQSPVARKVVLKLLESAFQADQLEAQAIRDIREQHGDDLPLDFSSQINRRIMPELDRLSVSVSDLLENPFVIGEGTEIATVPEASPANKGKAYFDTESNTWKISDGSKMITAKNREQAKKVVDRIKGT